MSTILLALALTTSAYAKPKKQADTDTLHWTWEDGQTRRYYGHVEVSFPMAMAMGSVANVNGQVQGFKTDVILSCAKSEVGKRDVKVRCDVENLSIQGRARSTSKGKIGSVAEEWSESGKNAWIVLAQRPDGHFTVDDFGGPPNGTVREQDIFVAIRMMIIEAIGSLDVQLPKSAALTVGQTWRQNSGEMVAMPSMGVSAMGSTQLDHRVVKDMPNGQLISYNALGQSTIALPSVMTGLSGSGGGPDQSTSNLYKIEGIGSWVYDAATGTVVQSQFKGHGKPTAGSAMATTIGAVYDILTYTQLLTPGSADPVLPAPAEY